MEELHRQRLKRLSQALAEDGLTQMIVSDPLAIWYFTGVDVQPGERLFVLYARADGSHKLFLNKLFTVSPTGLEEVWMTDTDDTVGILARAVDHSADMGVDKNWPARFLLALMDRNPGVRYVNSSG
ncbi:MAG: aminopeptidase P family N-terminal domain-containing protein, partial [Clostridium sp.]|nr:aminopeptidase P family N-terminal domain-containing protein [Clostridium sp.]